MISVIICTYNRASALRKCLESFKTLTSPEELKWELVVVDNNSTDETESLLAEFQAQSTLPLVTVKELKQGLGNARNAGFKAANYDIIAYTDDDCYPDKNYLTSIRDVFADPAIAFAGGRVLLHNPDDLRITIQLSEIEKIFQPGDMVLAGEIHGANFCFRRQVLEEVGGFDPLFGAGASFPCEDVDTISECIRHGFAGKYSPDIIVSHDHGRQSESDYQKLMHSYDVGRGAFYTKRVIMKPGQRYMYAKFWFYFIRKQPFDKTMTEIRSGVNYLFLSAKSFLVR
ncbi:glycosyltransferase [Alteromonas halophila]|uniref:Glycosyltransferase 2-like domain-containing protein n=1 Tax=Alteromonas halophila TaxID=516698 RepID=A0A918JL42_9ALTE|nr:glycosyltransferase family 2 protein [Alteromonas halophila]GGW86956.1 hypothetical protein GCM10007391_20930 [Alteromonas halophila]